MSPISIIEIYDLEKGQSQELFRYKERIEAPNWAPKGDWLLVNSAGLLWKLPLKMPELLPIETGPANRCNNDHGFTKDGRILFGSHYEQQGAQIYAIPEKGGVPEKISTQAPSWWHGLSPDGKFMVYPAVRDEKRSVQIFKRALAGGPEEQLTFHAAHSDGPEFSANGKEIYWNCDASGHAQIWVMKKDGSDQRPLFHDNRVNWFPHPSPCGNHLVYLSYPPGTQGHPADLPVQLVLCRPDGSQRQVIAEFIGGQGTINVPSWRADGGAFAYIRYE